MKNDVTINLDIYAQSVSFLLAMLMQKSATSRKGPVKSPVAKHVR